MRVGLLADTHDRLPAISALLAQMAEGGVGLVLHAGDYCSPFSLVPFIDSHMALAGVFGRNDGDPEGIKAKAQQGMGLELYESPHSFDIGGKRILVVHDLGEISARSVESHQLVVHGCSHRQDRSERGGAVLVNPGEGCGWLYGVPSAAIVDLDTLEVQMLRLEGGDWRA